MMNVKGYAQLTDEQKQLFDETYKAHLSMMGNDTKAKHQEQNIEEIKWDKNKKCLKVYFDNGDWYHYEDCKWY